jgi:serine phosphatase RsbU (regulator of sigma subunit)
MCTEYFIFFKPRDIVSGDFYFLQKINKHILVAAVDCTGHGVPGAFMSMLGIAFLNEIVRRREITQASQVLNILRQQIKTSLKQTGKKRESKDGMDIAICAINTETFELQFAGAYNPLYLIRNNELTIYKGDRMPIGIYRKEKETFTNHIITLERGDKIYLFSDGFVDQINGETKEKFMSNNFKNLITEISALPMIQQKDKLEETFNNWKGNSKQIDDVVIIGVEVN